MPILNNGNGDQTSTNYVVANPDFVKEATSKVLGASSQDTSVPGAGNGDIERGYPSMPFKYYDEAVSIQTGLGRYYEGQQGHAVPQIATASSINVPASVYPQTVSNIGARFMR